MSQLLEGVRILDLSHVYFGPYATMILGSMGAEVIKVEPPWGEMARFYPPLVQNESTPFMFLNRNKKGMTINLKSEKGKEIFWKLLTKSDVIVENFKRGTMDRLGLGYSALERLNPGVIMVSITPFGQTGPYKAYKP